MAVSDLSEAVQKRIISEFRDNKEVFAEVYDFYFDQIIKYLAKRTMSSEVAYDLAAETFIKAFESFHKFKWSGISIKVWLYRIAINGLKNYRRKPELLELSENQHEISDVKEELNALDKALFGDEELSQLSDAIATLNPKYQNIVGLYYFSEMSQTEIAIVIGKSVSAVKAMMHRAIENLRQMLSPNLL